MTDFDTRLSDPSGVAGPGRVLAEFAAGLAFEDIPEAVRRRALAREVYERVSVVGFALLILIWVIALSNDFSSTAPR